MIDSAGIARVRATSSAASSVSCWPGSSSARMSSQSRSSDASSSWSCTAAAAVASAFVRWDMPRSMSRVADSISPSV